jgi:hypothetical protein
MQLFDAAFKAALRHKGLSFTTPAFWQAMADFLRRYSLPKKPGHAEGWAVNY